MSDPEKLCVAIQSLVQVDLNTERYNDEKERGANFVAPLRSNSASIATYYFGPNTKYTIDDIVKSAEFLSDPSGEDKHLVKEKITAKFKSTSATREKIVQRFKSENSDGDRILFGQKCGVDDDKLRQQFQTQNIQGLGRPQKQNEDKLGLAERFKVREATLEQLRSDIQKARLSDDDQTKLPAAIKKERDRLTAELALVRAKLIEKLNAEWVATIRRLGVDGIRDDKVDTPGVMKSISTVAHFESDKAEHVARLVDLRRLYERIEAVTGNKVS